MEKEKKAIYKKWWFWVIVILIILVFASTGSSDNKEINATETTSKPSANKVEVVVIDFSSMNKTDIQAWCDTNKIKCNIVEDYSDTIEKGGFISQSVEVNTIIYQGDTIKITYSLSKKPSTEETNALKKRNHIRQQCICLKRVYIIN